MYTFFWNILNKFCVSNGIKIILFYFYLLHISIFSQFLPRKTLLCMSFYLFLIYNQRSNQNCVEIFLWLLLPLQQLFHLLLVRTATAFLQLCHCFAERKQNHASVFLFTMALPKRNIHKTILIIQPQYIEVIEWTFYGTPSVTILIRILWPYLH